MAPRADVVAMGGGQGRWLPSQLRASEASALGASAARRAACRRRQEACEAGLRDAVRGGGLGRWQDRERASRPALQRLASGERVPGAWRRRRNASWHSQRVLPDGFASASVHDIEWAAAGPRLGMAHTVRAAQQAQQDVPLAGEPPRAPLAEWLAPGFGGGLEARQSPGAEGAVGDGDAERRRRQRRGERDRASQRHRAHPEGHFDTIEGQSLGTETVPQAPLADEMAALEPLDIKDGVAELEGPLLGATERLNTADHLEKACASNDGGGGRVLRGWRHRRQLHRGVRPIASGTSASTAGPSTARRRT
ncbi:unnamed protein product [Prorocentrum cordatum]|uniref:Uncharacterized protein n=1 Tax=Prorocentrum cordatum TaxID=2364126 RepID=A0ABN9YB86_9DINO|nr:unnamed protein product [Polarella glacialis]